VGTCPYRDRCVYLHDPRLIYRDAKTKTRKKNSEDSILDSFFWPTMPIQEVRKKLDSSKQPHVIQNYVVPGPDAWNNPTECIHDQAIYSMWMHFTEFCGNASSGVTDKSSNTFNSKVAKNQYSKRQRLALFVNLSNGVVPTTENINEHIVKANSLPVIPQQQSLAAAVAGAGYRVDTRKSPETVTEALRIDLPSPTTVADQENLHDKPLASPEAILSKKVFPEIPEIDSGNMFEGKRLMLTVESTESMRHSIFGSSAAYQSDTPRSKLSDFFAASSSASVLADSDEGEEFMLSYTDK